GLFWGGMNNGVQQLIGLVFGIILGRLLSPDDFGMIAMITIFTVIAVELQSSGFKTALANMEHPSDNDYNSVFWFNIVVSLGIYVILFFCAPLIARYYHQPALTPLCRYVFLSFVFSSFGLAQSAYLYKNLRTKQQAKAGMTAIIVSNIIGAVMAWKGFSYWSLATQSIVYVLICTLMYWHYSDWRPKWHFDPEPIKRMFPFSCKIMFSAIFTQVNNQILNILLGRFFTPRDAGNYNQAYQWDYKCFNLLQGMVQTVAQPVFVDLKSDGERQLRAMRKLIRFTAFLSFPLLFGFGMVSHEFIITAIGEKWSTSASYLQLLCIAGAFMPINTLLYNMIISKGRSDTYMWNTLALGLCQLVLMLVLYPYGVRTMIFGYVILNICWLFVWHYAVQRLTGYRLLSLLKDIAPFALCALGTMLLTAFITRDIQNLVLLLIVRIILAIVIYYIVMRVAGAQILKECMQFLLSKTKNKHHETPC
ncbi:MAG: lipopolysaccharide biosynthesis protein, partial [Prevotella sp.]|nr:lipopolysaccharide biosynthesis protein [Prevotella sp.]